MSNIFLCHPSVCSPKGESLRGGLLFATIKGAQKFPHEAVNFSSSGSKNSITGEIYDVKNFRNQMHFCFRITTL